MFIKLCYIYHGGNELSIQYQKKKKLNEIHENI